MKFRKKIDWDFLITFLLFQVPFYYTLYIYTVKNSEYLDKFQSFIIGALYFFLVIAMNKIRKLENKVENLKCQEDE